MGLQAARIRRLHLSNVGQRPRVVHCRFQHRHDTNRRCLPNPYHTWNFLSSIHAAIALYHPIISLINVDINSELKYWWRRTSSSTSRWWWSQTAVLRPPNGRRRYWSSTPTIARRRLRTGVPTSDWFHPGVFILLLLLKSTFVIERRIEKKTADTGESIIVFPCTTAYPTTTTKLPNDCRYSLNARHRHRNGEIRARKSLFLTQNDDEGNGFSSFSFSFIFLPVVFFYLLRCNYGGFWYVT